MTSDEIRAAILGALRSVAPEIDPTTIRSDVPLRDQVDLDSIDFLNFLMAIHAALGVDIPDTAYTQVATLDGCVAYVASHGAQAQSVAPGER
ncbi:MAG TPA: acyl carrier protein [Gemmatimonadaceae bacterium]|nr:acyl carrier protein [Gemmatimonadaceae bacterium]